MFPSKQLYLEEKQRRFDRILPSVLSQFYRLNTCLSGKLPPKIFTQIKKITSARVSKSFVTEAAIASKNKIKKTGPVPRPVHEVTQGSCCELNRSVIVSLRRVLASSTQKLDLAERQRDHAVAVSVKLQQFVDDLKRDLATQTVGQNSSRSVQTKQSSLDSVVTQLVADVDSLIKPVVTAPVVKPSSWFSRLTLFPDRIVPDCPDGTVFPIWDSRKCEYLDDCVVYEKKQFNLYGTHQETGFLRIKARDLIRSWVVGATYVCLDGKYSFAADKSNSNFTHLPVIRRAQSKGFYLRGMRPTPIPVGRIIRME